MSSKRVDRRILHTKQAIRDALVALIEEKGFDNLTVSDIAGKADINRGTFYLHYKDKFDLLEQTVATLIRDLEHIFTQANFLKLFDLTSRATPIPLVVRLFEYLHENAALMRIALGLGSGVAFQARVRNVIEQKITEGALAGLKAEKFLVPREYLISYILHAHFGVIQSWLEGGCKESPQEMALILSRLSLDGPLRATGAYF